MSKELDKIAIEAGQIVKKGQLIYKRLKKQYDPKYRGKYLAIEVKSGEAFLGKDGAEATIRAQKKYPSRKVFLQKVGFDSAELMMNWYISHQHG